METGSFSTFQGLVQIHICRLKNQSAEVFQTRLEAVLQWPCWVCSGSRLMGNGDDCAGPPENSSAHSCIISQQLPITVCAACVSNVCDR